jgi:uncharacterized protein with beta-barrel porin domain
LPEPLVVAVTGNGQPLANRVVTWQVTSGSATLAKPSTTTGANGQTQNTLTLGATPGAVVVTASANGASVSFTTAQGSPTLSIVSGNSQTGIANTPLPQPLVVAVTGNGQPLANQAVTWRVTAGSATLARASTSSAASGQTQNTLTLGATTGSVTVTASVNGASVSFAVNNATQAAAEGLKSFTIMGDVAVLTTTVQTTNLGIRLAELRRGATGVSMGGLTLDLDGKSFPLGAVASLAPGLGSESGADQSSLAGKLGLFVNGQGSFGDQDATSREPGFDFHTAGVTAGVDYRFTKELILGLAGGYVSTTSNLDASAGEFTAHGASVSVFGTYYIGQSFYADLIATYGWNGYETTRRIGFDSVTASANGDTDGRQVAVSVGGGYDARLRAWTLGLHGRVNYINVRIDGFQESGAGLFDLNVDQQTIESLTTVLGAHVSYAISLPWGVLLPQVTAEWEHQYLNDSRIIDGTLVADPTQSALGVPTNTPDRDYFNLGAGVSATFGRGFSAFVYYETVLGEQNFTVHSFTGGIRYEF